MIRLLAWPGRYLRGFGAFFRGLGFIARYRLWGYLVLPAFLSLSLGVILILLGFFTVRDGVLHLYHGSDRAWLATYEILANILAVAIALFVTLIGYQTLVPLVVIPFLGPLLNRVEIILTGQPIEVGWWQDVKNALIGGWFALRDAILQLLCLGLTLFLGPGQPIIMLLISGYFLGRGSFDYLLEKQSQTLKERFQKTRRYWPEIQGLGSAQVLGLFIPLLGILLVPASGVVGAALLVYGSTEIDTSSEVSLKASDSPQT